MAIFLGYDVSEFDRLLREDRGIDLAKIEEQCARAEGVVVAWQVEHVRQSVEHARDLFRQGERLAAMEAGQAAWNLALGLFNALESKRDVQAGRKVRSGGTKGAEASRTTRRGPGSKRADILEKSAVYSGPEAARVNTLVRLTGATERYVRSVLKNPEA